MNLPDGKKIVLCADTGAGKSSAVFSSAYEALQIYNAEFGTDFKILMLSPRSVVREEQAHRAWRGRHEDIEISTYQTFIENEWKSNQDAIIRKLKSYWLIFCDESHYFLNDCDFNFDVRHSYEALVKTDGLPTRIFASATNQDLISFFNQTRKNYILYESQIKKTVVKDITFYEDNGRIDDLIAKTLSENAKIVVCFKKLDDAARCYFKYQNQSTFICSAYQAGYFVQPDGRRKKYTSLIDTEKRNRLIRTHKLQKPILIVTTAVDVGFSIIDEDVRYMVTDLFDLPTIKQFVGRKRSTNGDDKVHLYIQNRKGNSVQQIYRHLQETCNQINQFKILGAKQYVNLYNDNTLSKPELWKKDIKGHLKSVPELILDELHAYHTQMQLERAEQMLKRNQGSFVQSVMQMLGDDIPYCIVGSAQDAANKKSNWLENHVGYIFVSEHEKQELRDVINAGVPKSKQGVHPCKLNNLLSSGRKRYKILTNQQAKGTSHAWKLVRM